MKKMLKNKKGFSLIELLIVIAIMGVLAVIAFSMFSGVVANSRKKADVTQAGNIQKALVAYIVETGDSSLKQLKTGTDTSNDGKGGSLIAAGNTWDKVVTALQRKQYLNNTTYLPYLNAKNSSGISTAEFKCQWDKHTGYLIHVYSDRMNATVEPITDTAAGAAKLLID